MTEEEIEIVEVNLDLMECTETTPHPEHRIDYTKRKTVVVIDKDHFTLCKRFFMENVVDEEFANLLKIPIEKVRIFKHKMQIFEDKLRARRRAARLNCRRMRRKKKRLTAEKVGAIKKKEMSSEDRFKCARDLILQNYTTHEISKVLKISIRSVTRFRRRLRDQKKKMQEDGELEMDEEGEWEFRHLSPDLKGEKIKELYEQGLPATEIAKILKINERSVRRWRVRIEDMKKNPEKFKKDEKDSKQKDSKPSSYKPFRRYRKCVDRETVENTKKLLESGATNKEICLRLGIQMSLVMKIVKRIWTNTIEGIIDDTADKIRENEMMKKKGDRKPDKSELEVKKKKKKKKKNLGTKKVINSDDEDWDPHNQYRDEDDEYFDDEEVERLKEEVEMVQAPCDPLCDTPETPLLPAKKADKVSTKKVLSDREALIAHSLRENNMRTIDIALMMDISERTVTRLFNRAKDLDLTKISAEVEAEVQRFLDSQDQYRGVTKPRNKSKEKIATRSNASEEEDSGKMATGLKLLAMNVKITDIMKMLNVSERIVSKWKRKLDDQKKSAGSDGHSVFEDLFEVKEEPIDEEYGN